MKTLLVCGAITVWASSTSAQNCGGWPGTVELTSFPNIEVYGCLGTNYEIQSSTNLQNWKNEGNITLLCNPTTWCDKEGMQPQKFYRAMGPDPVQDPGDAATNQCLILPPVPCDTNQSYPLVMYFHGSGEDENSVQVGQPTNVTWAIRTNGFYVCAALGGDCTIGGTTRLAPTTCSSRTGACCILTATASWSGGAPPWAA
jgi:hypothetical protein